ncbi:hypothetical protein D3C78_711600 [compost metagenome]
MAFGIDQRHTGLQRVDLRQTAGIDQLLTYADQFAALQAEPDQAVIGIQVPHGPNGGQCFWLNRCPLLIHSIQPGHSQ